MIIIFALAANVDAKSVHWISIFDTNDTYIGTLNNTGRNTLFERIVTPFSIVLDSLGYDNYLYRIDGDNYKVSTVVKTIDNIETTPDDLIFLYYAGHGMAAPDSCKSQFPILFLEPKSSGMLPYDYIHEQISSKDCKGVVMVAVSSNGTPEKTNPINNLLPKREYLDSLKLAENIVDSILLNKDRLEKIRLTDTEYESIRHLITSLTGEILMCSAKRGLQSFGGDTPLGPMDFFTYVFAMSLEDAYAEGGIPDIKRIADEICTTVSDISGQNQIPFYRISNIK